MLLNRFDVDAVVLELDGTLIDTLGDFVLALNAMLADLPPPYRQHRLERDRIATLLGTAPRRTLMIGDSSNDAQAARAAGCPVLLVTYGYNHGEPVPGADADAFVDSLQSLVRADST